MSSLGDIYNGLAKSALFRAHSGAHLVLQGLLHKGGAQGVGRATTEAVVMASIVILISDYVLTSLMF